jgi:thrombospondin type 3 repeat protein
LKNFKVVLNYLILEVTIFFIILILVSGTISQVGYLVVASNGEEGEGGEEEGSGTEGAEGEVGTEAPDDEAIIDGANTEGVASEQESTCPAVAFEGPSYLDENGCQVPCPPPPNPPHANTQDANIPEGCLNPAATEFASQPTSQTPEEQLAPPMASLDDAPGTAAGESAEVCEDGKDNDKDGELDERDCILASLVDSDGDGVPDVKEDSDGDRVLDIKDNCPAKANSNQMDTNANGIGDLCDVNMRDQDFVDSDNDFSYEIRDNCPGTFNPDQKDTDGDGLGDDCDPDPNSPEENTKELCIDHIDNDGDGVADGHDIGCNEVLYEPYM